MQIATEKGREQMNSNYFKKACWFAKKPNHNPTTKPQHNQKNNLGVYGWFFKYSRFIVAFLTIPNETTRQF